MSNNFFPKLSFICVNSLIVPGLMIFYFRFGIRNFGFSSWYKFDHHAPDKYMNGFLFWTKYFIPIFHDDTNGVDTSIGFRPFFFFSTKLR